MPKITKLADFTFSVENFLDACSPAELKEVDILIQSNRYQTKILHEKIKLKQDQEEREEITNLGFDPEFFLGRA